MTLYWARDGAAPHTDAPEAKFDRGELQAVLFDLDGVLTSTAEIHAACWKQAFDDFLRSRSARTGEPFQPFDADQDYRRFVDGKPRLDGVRSFLAARGIALPEGSPASPRDEESISGLGNRKDELVEEAIRKGKARAYPGAVDFARWVRDHGLKTAVVSSSHHCGAVLEATGIKHLFAVQVDGYVSERLRLAGKPAPDTYLYAAKLLGVESNRAAVIEDAIAGVQAGRAGGFGLVIGVARQGRPEDLARNGADLVVSDLGDLLGTSGTGDPS